MRKFMFGFIAGIFASVTGIYLLGHKNLEVGRSESVYDAVPVDVQLKSSTEAREIIEALDAHILQRGFVTVEEYNDLLGWGSNFRDSKRGWTSTVGLRISPAEAGDGRVLLHLPEAKELS